jgi:hypothetical protein
MAASLDGTTVPPASSIIDNSGNSWGVVGGVVKENGANAGSSNGVTLLLWYRGKIYQKNSWNNWWGWDGTWGTQLAGDPRSLVPRPPAVSLDGTTVPPASSIIDNSGNSWGVVGGVVKENGANAGSSNSVTLLLWYKGKIYQKNSWNAWWGWDGTWGTQLAGDPRSVVTPPPPPPTPFAGSAASFLDTVGVHVHFERDWVPGPGPEPYAYQSDVKIINGLKYAGIKHVRGWFNDPAGSTKRQMRTIADLNAAGAKIDFQVTGSDYSSGFNYRNWALAHLNIIEAVEAGNEIDNWTATQTGCGGNTYQVSICATAALWNDFGKLGIPVYGPSLMNQGMVGQLGNMSGSLSDVNSHIYPGWAGGAPNVFTFIQSALKMEQVMGPGKPNVLTEGGWWSAPGNTGGLSGAKGNTRAQLNLTYLLDAYELGVYRVYFYELLNELYTTTSDPENNFGMFDYWGNPKPEATMLHNLNLILADSGTVTPSGFDYNLTGMPSTGHKLVFKKSDGSFWIALWNDAAIFNGSGGADISISTSNITLTPAVAPTSMTQYKATTSSSPINTTTSASANVTLNRDPIFIKVVP